MKKRLQRVFMFPVEAVATLLVCGFLFAMFGGMSASLSGNHRYRVN